MLLVVITLNEFAHELAWYTAVDVLTWHLADGEHQVE